MTFSYLRLLAGNRCEWVDHANKIVRRGTDDEFVAGDGQAWAVLVPTEDVLVTEIELPVKNRQKLMQAAPFAVEDQLVGDVDAYHFAIGRTFDSNRHLVAAVEAACMRSWLDRLERIGVKPDLLCPDALAIPFDGTPTMVGDGDRVLLRAGQGLVYAAYDDEIDDVLALMDIQRLRIVGEAGGKPRPGVAIDRLQPKDPTGRILESGLAGGVDLNLLQGDYAPQSQRQSNHARLLRWAAIAGIVASLLATGELVIRQQRGEARIAELTEQNRLLLTETFPEITRVVDPRVQMQQQLDELRRQAGQSGAAGFLSALRQAGPILASVASVEILTANYRRSELLFDLRGPDLTSIESLRQQLRSGGLEVDLQSATTLEGRAEARMKITL